MEGVLKVRDVVRSDSLTLTLGPPLPPPIRNQEPSQEVLCTIGDSIMHIQVLLHP